MSTISVLICTNNRPDKLEIALRALLEGSNEPPDQVVVVNGGDKRADRIVEKYQSAIGPETILVRTTNKNLAASRNLGFLHCNGDIIAMTDDDAEVFVDWVAKMKELHKNHPEAGAIGGAVYGLASDRSLISRIADFVTFPSPTQSKYVRNLPGVNVSYKREVVEKIGQQDESLFRGEDVDYNWRVKQLGYEVYYDPAVRVIHHHRASLLKFLHQYYMYGRAYYLVRKKWPSMYAVYPRTFRRISDVLKGVNFILSMLYQPFQFAYRMPAITDKVMAIPVLFTLQIAWKGGMVVQRTSGVRG